MLVGGSHTILALNNHSRRFVFTRLSDALWGERTDLDSSISTPIARLEHGGNRCQLLRHELVSEKTMCPMNSLTMVTDGTASKVGDIEGLLRIAITEAFISSDSTAPTMQQTLDNSISLPRLLPSCWFTI